MRTKELNNVCIELINALENFPTNKREEVLFDKWTLKNSVSHLNGWNLLRIKEIESFLKGEEIKKIDDFDALNVVFVNERKNNSWESVFNEFIDSCKGLVEAFNSIPEEMMEKKIWEGSSMTPKKWLKIDTDHMRDEHLAQLEGFKG